MFIQQSVISNVYVGRNPDDEHQRHEQDPNDAENDDSPELLRSVVGLLKNSRAPDNNTNLFDQETGIRLGYDADAESIGVYQSDEVRRPRDGRNFFDGGPQRRLTQWMRKNVTGFTGRKVPAEVLTGLIRTKTCNIVMRPAGDNMYSAGPDKIFTVCGSIDPRANRTRSASLVLYRSTP